jgi:hypothetical protein
MKKVRQDVANALSTVTMKNAPMVYGAIQTETGYKNMEDRIINLMIDENITASGCIPHLENTL